MALLAKRSFSTTGTSILEARSNRKAQTKQHDMIIARSNRVSAFSDDNADLMYNDHS